MATVEPLTADGSISNLAKRARSTWIEALPLLRRSVLPDSEICPVCRTQLAALFNEQEYAHALDVPSMPLEDKGVRCFPGRASLCLTGYPIGRLSTLSTSSM
jgi:hypothetical protein